MRESTQTEQHYWSQLVSDYLDGELAPADSLVVAGHLWECGECRKLLRDLMMIVGAARDLRDASHADTTARPTDEVFAALHGLQRGRLTARWEC